MGHTTFIPDQDRKPSSLDKLDWLLEEAYSSEREVYILAMSKGKLRNPEDIVQQCAKLANISSAILVNGTIDFVVVGDENSAKAVARKLHEQTGEKIAIIKYVPLGHTYLNIREALDVTERKGDPWHFYNPDTESIDALLKN